MTRSSPTSALLLALVLTLTGCTSGEDQRADDTPGGEDSSTTDAEASPSEAAPTEAAPTAEPILVADQPYVSPCRLFPPSDAADVLAMDAESSFSENGRAVDVKATDLAGDILPRIETRCTYSLPDSAAVDLIVEQFDSEQSAQARWRELEDFGRGTTPPQLRKPRSQLSAMQLDTIRLIKESQFDFGAVPVRGLDERILWREGNTNFIATTGNLLLTFQLVDGGPAHVYDKADARLAETVLTGALARAEEPPVGEPIAPFFEADERWPAWLDPCALLSDEALEALHPGQALHELTSRSTDRVPDGRSESPAGRAARNSCERESEPRSGEPTRSASLEVLHVAAQDEPEDVVLSDLAFLAFDDATPSARQVQRLRDGIGDAGVEGVDASYVVSLDRGGSQDYLFLVVLDRHVLTLEASQMLVEGSEVQDTSVDPQGLLEAMQVVADDARSAVG